MLFVWILLGIYLACMFYAVGFIIKHWKFAFGLDKPKEDRERVGFYIFSVIMSVLFAPFMLVDFLIYVLKSKKKELKPND